MSCKDSTHEPTPKQTPMTKINKPKPKLLAFLTSFGVILILLFAFVPGLKEYVYGFGQSIKGLGTFGPFLLVPICGLIAIPLGLPFMIFEMTNALITENMGVAILISVCSKFVGGSCCYFLGKYKMKKRIVKSLEGSEIYKGIDSLITKRPFKISCVIRITNLPLFIKNYGLLLSDKVNYGIYTGANMITGVFSSAVEINIFKQATNFSEVMNDTSPGKKIYTVLSLVISVLVFVYIVCYTRKIVRMLKKETAAKYAEMAKQNSEDRQTIDLDILDAEDEKEEESVKVNETSPKNKRARQSMYLEVLKEARTASSQGDDLIASRKDSEEFSLTKTRKFSSDEPNRESAEAQIVEIQDY